MIVSNSKENIIKQINDQCVEIYKNKLELMNITSNNLEYRNRKFELGENQNDFLKDLTNYIPNLLTHLWENPKAISTLLSYSDIDDIKNHLASFIVNNFYENILSSNSIENNLMFVFTLLLKEEINNLKNVNEPEVFLDNSPCSLLLKEIIKKDNIRQYFKQVLLNIIENLETYSSDNYFNLDIKSLKELFDKNKEDNSNETIKGHNQIGILDEKINKQKIIYYRINNSLMSINRFDEDSDEGKIFIDNEFKKVDEFTQKYVCNLTIKDIKAMITEKYLDNKNMKDYCTNQIINCGQNMVNRDFYSNKLFMENLYCSRSSREILYLYQYDFVKIIEFIDQIFLSIKENMYLIPYSLKCICKIISELIINKFPDINEPQKMAFISCFFCKILLIPVLENPGFNLLIDNFIISRNTLNNIKIIVKVLGQLISGKFFTNCENNCDYTPFNWYFLEKMPDIYEIFEQLTKVSLPQFIDDFLKGKLEDDYHYNYFKENTDKNIFYRAICYNVNDINIILNSMDKCKEKIFINNDTLILKKTFDKLNLENNKKLIEELIANEEYEILQRQKNVANPIKSLMKINKEQIEFEQYKGRQKLTHFLLTSLLTNEKYSDLFKSKEENKPNYTIKELKKATTKKDKAKNNIIKTKNYLICLLYNYSNFATIDSHQDKSYDTINILNILKTYLKLSNHVFDEFIPTEWYINSLLEYLKKIPKEYRENDFQKLYEEIEDEINLAIKKIDFGALSLCFEKVKISHKEKNYYFQIKGLINNLLLNEKVKSIIEDEFIPVKIDFTYTNDKKGFILKKSKMKEKDYFKKKSENKIKLNLCKSIKSFTKKFPNLTLCKDIIEPDLIKVQTELNIPGKLSEYLNMIKEHLLTNKKVSAEEDMESIIKKIEEHIMTKIYNKIFPMNKSEKDEMIEQKCIELAWTEPKHFIQEKKLNYVFDSFLPDAIHFFTKIEEEKSPMKKIENMKEIFNSIYKLVKFNGDDNNTGVDDLMPILNYAFIKAKPIMIYSNLMFIDLYIGDLKNKEEGSQLTQLMALCDYICSLEAKDLLGVSNEEFTSKCSGNISFDNKSDSEL